MKDQAAKLDTAPLAERECAGCGTVAESPVSQTPSGWRRTLQIAAFPGRCVTWRCAACAAEKTGGTE